MKTAKEMFEELGYKYFYEKGYGIQVTKEYTNYREHDGFWDYDYKEKYLFSKIVNFLKMEFILRN